MFPARRIEVTAKMRTVALALHESLRALPSGQVFTLWDALVGVSLFLAEFSKTMARDLLEDEDFPKFPLSTEDAVITTIASMAQNAIVSEDALRKLLKAIHEGEQKTI